MTLCSGNFFYLCSFYWQAKKTIFSSYFILKKYYTHGLSNLSLYSVCDAFVNTRFVHHSVSNSIWANARARIEYCLMMRRDFSSAYMFYTACVSLRLRIWRRRKKVCLCSSLSRWNVMIWLSISVVRPSVFFSNTIRINKTLARSHHSFPHDVWNYLSRYFSFAVVRHRQ